MSARGTVTAIVPTYNRAQFLTETLAALRAQTRPLHEIIVWDDGSTDATRETVAALQIPGLRYFRQENAGKSAALNRALTRATGDYIWICDDDDLARPEAADLLAGALDADPLAGIAGGRYLRFRDRPDGVRERQGPGHWPDLAQGSPLRHLLEDIFLFQNAMMARRACYDAAGPFREDLPRSIDYDMVIRLAARFPVRMVDAVVFDQRKHDGARGPAAARHAAAKSEAVWAEWDRRIFAQLRPILPLTLYEAMFEGGDPDLRRRAALLQRGCVQARRNDWPAALEDLAAAARIEAGPLTGLEIDICRRSVSGKYTVSARPGDADWRALARLRHGPGRSTEIARALSLGLRWRLREAIRARSPAEAARIARLTALLGGPRLVSPPPAETSPAALRERVALPPEAYAWVAGARARARDGLVKIMGGAAVVA